jgi:hypothetical protein
MGVGAKVIGGLSSFKSAIEQTNHAMLRKELVRVKAR